MSSFRTSRLGFLRRSAGAATLGLAACGGGGGVNVPSLGNGTPAPGTTPAPGSGTTPTPTPAAAASPTPSATSTPTSSPTGAGAGNFPSGSVSSGSRGPNSLPDSTRPAGQPNPNLPFDYVVVIMMENHSFDNYFGMLPLRGQPLADGFTFDANGVPQNKNPIKGGYQHVFRIPGTCQPNGVTQTWTATRTQVNSGRMDGFAGTDSEAMGYWDEPDIPFYYSFAKTFCLGNRSFCSATAQTYPNRRYLYAGTSSGLISTSTSSFSMAAPTNGTLMDMMSKYGVSWRNYFTDLPALAIVPQNIETYPQNFSSIAQFFVDCAAGTLPAVSFVDPEFGLVDVVGGELFGALSGLPNLPSSVVAGMNSLANKVNAQGGDEENPQDIAIGEAFVAQVVNAVMKSPLWPRTLLVWTYDEHGGYYDHVPPLSAPLPDAVPPMLSANDTPGSFNLTGIRIPTVVASPYSRPNAVSNVPHDHTSIIASIAAKWNLPALTYRDAQANTLFDYCNFNASPTFLTPPTLAAPSAPAGTACAGSPPPVVVSPNSTRRSAR
jgi:phospholipase C